MILAAQGFRKSLMFYGEHTRGETKAETLYGYNRPAAARVDGAWRAVAPGGDVPAGAASWRYVGAGGTTTQIDYDAGGAANAISCGGAATASLECPEAFGVSLGMREDDVVARLGLPARQAFLGPVKRIDYPDLGLTLDMSEFAVTRITTVPMGGRGDGWLRFLRVALP